MSNTFLPCIAVACEMYVRTSIYAHVHMLLDMFTQQQGCDTKKSNATYSQHSFIVLQTIMDPDLTSEYEGKKILGKSEGISPDLSPSLHEGTWPLAMVSINQCSYASFHREHRLT